MIPIQPSGDPDCGRQPFGRVDPRDLEENRRECAAQTMGRTVQRQAPGARGHRTVCSPRDQQVDGGVVETAHPPPRPRAPGDPVIESADAEHRGQSRREHGADVFARSRRGDDQGHPEDEGDEERVLVEDAAKPRPDCIHRIEHRSGRGKNRRRLRWRPPSDLILVSRAAGATRAGERRRTACR